MKRVQIHDAQPTAIKAMMGLEGYLETTDLTGKLVELVKLLASQINGCVYCIGLHTSGAKEHGASPQQLAALPDWRNSSDFTNEERAAFTLAEEVTLISENGVSNAVYQDVQAHFSETQIAQLIMVLVVVNAWNRIAVSAHS